MPIVDSIEYGFVYAILFAVPVLVIFCPSPRSYFLSLFQYSLSIVWEWFIGIWNSMWRRGRTFTNNVPEDRGRFLRNMVTPPENDCCSICHDSFTLPCQANCGHWFCGDCILRVWHHTSALQPCKCPICRQPINLLVPYGSLSARREDDEVERVLREVADYNRIHSGSPIRLYQRMRDMPLLLRRMLQDLMDPQRGFPLVHRMRIIIYLILLGCYIFSPLDLIPEGLFGFFGLLDDFLLMLLVFLHIASIYRTVLVHYYSGQTH